MSALLLDEHPPEQIELEIVALPFFGEECWISECARPRVDGVLCGLHAPQRSAA